MTVSAVVTAADNGIVRMALRGALSRQSASEVLRVLGKCLGERPIVVVVDVAALSVDDRVHLTVFPTALAAQIRSGPALALIGATPALRRMAGGGVLGAVMVCDTVEQALAAEATRASDTAARFNLLAEPSAPATARTIASDYCLQHGLSDTIEPAVLVTSELVTNAIEHSNDNIQVKLAVRGEHLYVSVHDHSQQPPIPTGIDRMSRSPSPPTRGRGLHLIDVFSTAWGSIPTIDGKTVWAAVRIRKPRSPTRDTRPEPS